jgi:predicted acylesterase/phospholipase RssA
MAKPVVLEPCDLVMQGGITSGIVYPGAVVELSQKYRFHNIGGASAGAIAAVAAAAAEYGRGRGGFAKLDAAAKELYPAGFLAGLFQPTPSARDAYRLLLPLIAGSGSVPEKLLKLVEGIAGGASVAVPGIATAAVLLGLDILLGGFGFWATLMTIVVALVIYAGWMALHVFLAGRRLLSALGDQGYGFCPGRQQPGEQGEALVEWLHRQVQTCAGLAVDGPALTFAMLADRAHDIHLRLVTTDLSHGRPVTLPLQSDDYLFREADLAKVLPDHIVRQMMGASKPVDGYYKMPQADLPVVVAARLSLSFPVLLSAVQLWAKNGDEMVPHLLSDGGISSNFPIHFFDSWLPRWPTIGLSLQEDKPGWRSKSKVYLPSPIDTVPLRWSGTADLTHFAQQVFDASRNWRDSLQSEVPGSSDRICHIFLAKNEGGLNLNMDPEIIKGLDQRGHDAGTLVRDSFNFQWHRQVRHQELLRRLQVSLHKLEGAYQGRYRKELEADELRFKGMPPDWCRPAAAGTRAVTGTASAFGSREDGAPFHPEKDGAPRPILRIVPDV